MTTPTRHIGWCGTMTEPCEIDFEFGVDADGNMYPWEMVGSRVVDARHVICISVYPPGPRPVMIMRVKLFNTPGDVAIDSVKSGDSDSNFLLSSFGEAQDDDLDRIREPPRGQGVDAAFFNVEGGCSVDWGCMSQISPLCILAHSMQNDGYIHGVRGTIFGEEMRR